MIFIKLSDIIINFLISIAASVSFYVYMENLKKPKTINNSKKKYSLKYIANIKKQFYICFLSVSSVIIYDLYNNATKESAFLSAFKLVIIFWLLLFTLFAFMCSMDIVDNFTKEIPKDSSTDRDNDI